MAWPWMSCPQCRMYFQREEWRNTCPSCNGLLPGAVPAPEPGWFYVRERQKLGPVSAEELRAMAARGHLARSDMVLRQGETRWGAASSVPGLFPTTLVAEAILVDEPSPSWPAGSEMKEALLVTDDPPAPETGNGEPQQLELAANWYQRAARQGHASGLYSLASMLERGSGIGQDPRQAYMLYELAGRAFSADPNADYPLIPHDRSGLGSAANQMRMRTTLSPVDVVKAKEQADAWKVGQPFPA